MICVYCEQQISHGPDIIGGHGEYAHRRCDEEVGRKQRDRDAQSEIARLRRRVRELERQLAPFVARQRDPHDVDDDDDVHCPNGGRLIR